MMKSMCAAVLTAAVVAAVPALAQVQKKEIAGIANYSRVDATVGCGGRVDPAAMRALRAEGYVSVVNLRQASEPGADIDAGRKAAQEAGLKYIHLPFDAAAPDSRVVDSFLAAVNDRANQPVFIHCGSANRVGGLWLIKRVVNDGWSIDRAQAEAETIGLSSARLAAFATEYVKTRRVE
jgi:uncharacterized protein (TIGR01244 family)